MAKSNVTFNGVQYPSRIAAAKAMVASGKSISEAAKETGITYQSVYVNTKGSEKGALRRAKYRILTLGRSGRSTAGQIAAKAGVSTAKVVSMLKNAGIPIVTKETLAATKSTKETKTQKVAKTSKTKKVSKSKKVAVAAKVETPSPVAQENVPSSIIEDHDDMNATSLEEIVGGDAESARASAEADMISE